MLSEIALTVLIAACFLTAGWSFASAKHHSFMAQAWTYLAETAMTKPLEPIDYAEAFSNERYSKTRALIRRP